MPIYRVKGVDRTTGEKRFVMVTASTTNEALSAAGFAVTSIISTGKYRQRVYWAATIAVLMGIVCLLFWGKISSLIGNINTPPLVVEPDPIVTGDIPESDVPEPTFHEPTWRDEDNSVAAFLMMHEFVKQTLISPSTASFPVDEFTTQVRRLRGQRYYVSGAVDASNSFGAIVRSEYTGVIQQVSEDEWELIDLKIQGR